MVKSKQMALQCPMISAIRTMQIIFASPKTEQTPDVV